MAADGDLLAAIGEQVGSALDLETFAREHGIGGTFWNRMGD